VLPRLARILVILALCLSIGAHWAALQSVAWATMLVENARHASVSDAIMKTFDGNHPCDLCKRVATAEHSPKKSDAQPSTPKPDLICTMRTVAVRLLATDVRFESFEAAATARVSSPPTPPPRTELA
jgi:hypothetical protein